MKVATVAVILATALLTQSSGRAEPIGLPSCWFIAGRLVDLSSDSGLKVEHFQCESALAVVLSRVTSHDERGQPAWQIVDTVKVSDVRRFEEIEDSTCSRAGTVDRDLIALGFRSSPHLIEQVRRAWKIDRDSGRLREVTPEGITCEPYFPRGHEDAWYEMRRRQAN